MSSIPITIEGAERIRKELQELKSVKRPEVIQAIAEARAHGDLKENAEYHAAKEQQSFIEGRIAELGGQLSVADIIDVTRLDAGGKIIFGATVKMINIETDDEVCYQIVGDIEADISKNRISISSPIARAMIGKEVGDEIQVNAPSGTREYEILEVSYGAS